MQDAKNNVVKKLSSGIELLFRKYKVDRMNGTARVHKDKTITISGNAKRFISATKIIIAAGSRPTLIAGVDIGRF